MIGSRIGRRGLSQLARPTNLKPKYDHYINGKFVAPLGAKYFENVSPIDGKVFNQHARGCEKDIAAATKAAKEAFFKALTDQEIFSWEDIEVINQSNGAPRFNFRNKLAEFALDKNIHLSISHSGDSVIAFVIIEN